MCYLNGVGVKVYGVLSVKGAAVHKRFYSVLYENNAGVKVYTVRYSGCWDKGLQCAM